MNQNKQVIWHVHFHSLPFQDQTLNLMLCLDTETKKIESWSVGFQPITIQNLERKLEDSIKSSKSARISMNLEMLDSYHSSKSFQRFIRTMSEKYECSVHFLEKDSLEESKKDFLAQFENLLLGNRTLIETVRMEESGVTSKMVQSMVHKYVVKWNTLELDIPTLYNQVQAQIVTTTLFDKRDKLEALSDDLERAMELEDGVQKIVSLQYKQQLDQIRLEFKMEKEFRNLTESVE